MTTATIRVTLAEDGRWTVQSDSFERERFYFLSRAEAIAAGVQKALEQAGLLVIYGVGDQRTELELARRAVIAG
ncbi:hypothetical protein BKK79_20920 [Cupriavidus sp. USMAA2-4]|uniref:DUF2188 domain-containing protein n=1 Tax=Cupriavidus malaysiensis TaxID=367825 RepID=A0A1D9ICW4_9BURK|nr:MULTISPECIES: DUF2188 domain-containing protein [Cupriavidus]AOY94418.1 hypothetical protein BKK79_20920 [Cupriavidus sp. USMAA2-4]AOZ02675.1 hypothetical protein BKK81_26090 [Cupriavidus sp. USMAHM13]AOZ09959.1 hypothetical protein BKK80_30265 [Cupriavidus malaysiensis]